MLCTTLNSRSMGPKAIFIFIIIQKSRSPHINMQLIASVTKLKCSFFSTLLILFCWTLPIALIFPSYHNGETGLIEATGSCSFIPNPKENCGNLGETLLYSIGFAIPSGLILLSYVAIFLKVKSRLICKKNFCFCFKDSKNGHFCQEIS